MTVEASLDAISDHDLWELVKSRVFKYLTVWDIVLSKVEDQQPDDSRKRLLRMFEEIEFILNMFQTVVTQACTIIIGEASKQKMRLVLDDHCFVVPDSNISQFLGIPPHSTHIYLNGKWDPGCFSIAGKQEQLTVQPDFIKKENEDDSFVEDDLEPDFEDLVDVKEESSNFPKLQQQEDRANLTKYCVPDTAKVGGLHCDIYPVSEDAWSQMKSGQTPKLCPKCGKYFTNIGALAQHFKTGKGCQAKTKAPKGLEFCVEDPDTGVKQYGCNFDGCHEESKRLWKSKYSVHFHYQKDHGDYVTPSVPCKLCEKKFLSTTMLKEHQRSHKKKKLRLAAEAVKTEELDDSEPLDGKKRRKKSQPCVWKESYPIDEETFLKMKNSEIDKVCPNCKLMFNSFYCMLRHFERIKCKTDHRAVEAPPDLVIEINNEETKKLRFACAFTNCPDYGKTWNTKYGVYSHWQNEHIDSVENPVPCTLCPKKCISTVMLNMHMKDSHYKIFGKKYSCSICGVQKDSPKLMSVHEATHQSAKTFGCDYCEYKTNTKHNKQAHMRYMHAEKLGMDVKYYPCEHCTFKSKSSNNLRQHIESAHSGNVKPDPKYQCPICNKQLKQDNSFRKHMANVHGVGERCSICNKLYKTKEVLEKHMKVAHEI